MTGTISGKKKAQQTLNNYSQRVTAQRSLLLQLIHQSYGHLDADDLYQKARREYPRISLSTVYRNLQLFKKLGLIEEHHFVEEHHLYEVKPSKEHQHLFCLGCGKIIEFACPLGQQFRDNVRQQYNFDVSGIEIHVTGLCSKCQKKENESGKPE